MKIAHFVATFANFVAMGIITSKFLAAWDEYEDITQFAKIYFAIAFAECENHYVHTNLFFFFFCKSCAI